ncbi:MAG: DNA-processing protein DprA [Boseongicola sp.]
MAKDLSPSTHPLTPPLTEEDWLDWLRLLRSRRVGVATFFRLMKEYGSANEALGVLPKIAADAGVTNYLPLTREAAQAEWDAARQVGAVPIAYGSEKYPSQLAEITDPPPFLWAVGNTELLGKQTIAIVGARNASSLGTRMARRLATELGKAGFAVASGLARGVDTAAHLAAIETGTIAVMAGGVDVAYPAENAVLFQEIQDKGLRISEMPMNLAPQARHFPSRNRIISGLAVAVIVVEAAAKSGSLITARTALDQGRDVLAVPGHPFDARAAGSNMLLRDGATLVRSARDVIEAIQIVGAEPETIKVARREASDKVATSIDIAALHQQILERLGPSPVPEDQVIRDLKTAADIVSPAIVTLEMAGRIRRDAGGMLSRAN